MSSVLYSAKYSKIKFNIKTFEQEKIFYDFDAYIITSRYNLNYIKRNPVSRVFNFVINKMLKLYDVIID